MCVGLARSIGQNYELTPQQASESLTLLNKNQTIFTGARIETTVESGIVYQRSCEWPPIKIYPHLDIRTYPYFTYTTQFVLLDRVKVTAMLVAGTTSDRRTVTAVTAVSRSHLR